MCRRRRYGETSIDEQRCNACSGRLFQIIVALRLVSDVLHVPPVHHGELLHLRRLVSDQGAVVLVRHVDKEVAELTLKSYSTADAFMAALT